MTLIALFVAIKIFPYTLSVMKVLTTSPIGLLGMLIAFVFYAVVFTGLFISAVIEPKETPKVYEPTDKESVKKFTNLSEELEKKGLITVSEKLVFAEPNEKPVVYETVFKNASAEPITFRYALQFLLPKGSVYGGVATDVIILKPNEEYSATLISPASISGAVIVEKKLEAKGIFIELK
ncbi:hypothetical protein EMGBD2_01240 [Nitrospirota bacterium]|nr:hypothetical protein EMGBD2_01240 [Nitrospirota bacterium]